MENINTADIYKQMSKWQLLATLVVALLAFFMAGIHAAVSAFAGGLSAVIGGFIGGRIAKTGDKKQEAGAILIAMLKAEAVKIIVIALLLFLTFKLYQQLVSVALIVGLAASAILSGATFVGLDKK